MTDKFQNYNPDLEGPAEGGFAVTPSDSTIFSQPSRALYVGTGGNINLVTVNGTTLLLKNVVAGSVIPVRCQKIMSTSTTASDIVGLF